MRVFVTGGASGLGRALVEACALRGDEVAYGDLNPPTDSIPGTYLKLDIRDPDDWAAVHEWVVSNWGGLDLLINNAGVAGGGRIDVASMEEWEQIFSVNLFGVVRGVREFVPMMKAQRSGHIVNVASLAGLVHPAGMASYNAVKAAVVALTETLGHELDEWGIKASAVCPSYFRTNLVNSSPPGADRALGMVIGRMVDRSPFGPADIAAAVLAGVERGDDVILPDAAAQGAVDLKRSDLAAYNAMMRAQARKLEQAAGE